MTFNEKLKALMASKNVSMTQLANMTGITYNMIKKYCNSGAEPTVSYAILIADALGVSIDELADRNYSEKKPMFREVFEEDFTYIRGFMRNVRRFGSRTAVIDPPCGTTLT